MRQRPLGSVIFSESMHLSHVGSVSFITHQIRKRESENSQFRTRIEELIKSIVKQGRRKILRANRYHIPGHIWHITLINRTSPKTHKHLIQSATRLRVSAIPKIINNIAARLCHSIVSPKITAPVKYATTGIT